jgi:hypothetical protein
MEFVDNKAYLNDKERKATGIISPFVITAESLGELGKSIQKEDEGINNMMADWDVILHRENIELTIARNRSNNRHQIFGQIARYAAEQLPDLFSQEVEELTPDSFLELTK